MAALVMRQTRTSVLGVMAADFIRTARAKGAREPRVVLGHALRNALLPTITIIAINIGWLIGGLVVVESVFSYPGLGRLLVDAVGNKYVPVLQSVTLLIAAIYAVANLAADLLYAYLNPRIRYS
jgi:peptide/nickel transport system permease protein